MQAPQPAAGGRSQADPWRQRSRRGGGAAPHFQPARGHRDVGRQVPQARLAGKAKQVSFLFIYLFLSRIRNYCPAPRNAQVPLSPKRREGEKEGGGVPVLPDNEQGALRPPPDLQQERARHAGTAAPTARAGRKRLLLAPAERCNRGLPPQRRLQLGAGAVRPGGRLAALLSSAPAGAQGWSAPKAAAISRRGDDINPASTPSYLAYCVQVWASHDKEDIEVLGCVQKLVKGLKHKACRERMRELG